MTTPQPSTEAALTWLRRHYLYASHNRPNEEDFDGTVEESKE
jgi:hypothetical protein